MISKLHIKNFRSIVDMTVDFSYGEGKAPNGYKETDSIPFLVSPNKKRLVPCMALFGANASGKSNIIRAFGSLLRLAEGHVLKDVYDVNVTNPQKEDTTFVLDFVCGEKVVQYKISHSDKVVSAETLHVDGGLVFSAVNGDRDFSAVATAAYPEERLLEIIRVEACGSDGTQIRSVLNCLGSRYQGLNSTVTAVYKYFQSNQLVVFSSETTFPLPIVVDILSTTTDGDRKRALSDLVEVVRQLDIDVAGLEIQSREVPFDSKSEKGVDELRDGELEQRIGVLGKRFIHKVYSTHRTVSGELVTRDFLSMESTGTVRMASLVGMLLFAVRTGGTLVVDEFDNSLHSRIVVELIGMFKSKRYNTKQAQLFFATHNTDVLADSILRVSEIAIVNKNIHNGTQVRRLIDLQKDGEDIRNVTNFRRQYLDGFYAGVPYPAL